MSEHIDDMPTSNLVVRLQKMAKDITYYRQSYRKALLLEAARRLQEYRNKEREGEETHERATTQPTQDT